MVSLHRCQMELGRYIDGRLDRSGFAASMAGGMCLHRWQAESGLDSCIDGRRDWIAGGIGSLNGIAAKMVGWIGMGFGMASKVI